MNNINKTYLTYVLSYDYILLHMRFYNLFIIKNNTKILIKIIIAWLPNFREKLDVTQRSCHLGNEINYLCSDALVTPLTL